MESIIADYVLSFADDYPKALTIPEIAELHRAAISVVVPAPVSALGIRGLYSASIKIDATKVQVCSCFILAWLVSRFNDLEPEEIAKFDPQALPDEGLYAVFVKVCEADK